MSSNAGLISLIPDDKLLYTYSISPCHQDCLTCSGPLATQCTKCVSDGQPPTKQVYPAGALIAEYYCLNPCLLSNCLICMINNVDVCLLCQDGFKVQGIVCVCSCYCYNIHYL